MEGRSFFLQLIAQGCGNLAREEHLLRGELLSRYYILYYAILDKHNYYKVFLRNSNNLFLITHSFFVLINVPQTLKKKSGFDDALYVAI